MKKSLMISAVFMAAAVISIALAETYRDAAVLTFFDGDVSIRLNDESAWGDAVRNITLQEGDSIRTGPDGKARIVLEDESTLTIGPMSIFTIEEMLLEPATGRKIAAFNLEEGLVRARVAKLITSDSSFLIKTPSAVAGVRGTDFVVETNPLDNVSSITVIEGAVDVESRIGNIREKVRVLKEESTSVTRGGAPSKPAKVDTGKLRSFQQKLSHRGESGGPATEELSAAQASTIVAIKNSGIAGGDAENLETMVLNGDLPAEHTKTIVQMTAMGVPADQVMDTLTVIRNKDISEADLKNLDGQIRNGSNGAEIGQALQEFRTEAGGRPDRPDNSGPMADGNMPPKNPGGPHPANQPPPPGNIQGMKDDMGSPRPPQGENFDDAAQFETQFIRRAKEMGLNQYQIERLIQAYREKKLDRFEVEMFANAVSRGVNPELLRRTFTTLTELRVDRDVRHLIARALQIGLSKDQLIRMMDNIIDKKATMEQVKAGLVEFIDSKVTSTNPGDLKPDPSVLANDAHNELPDDKPDPTVAVTPPDGNTTNTGTVPPPGNLGDLNIPVPDGTTTPPDGTTPPPDGTTPPPDGTTPPPDGTTPPPDGTTPPPNGTTPPPDGTTPPPDGTTTTPPAGGNGGTTTPPRTAPDTVGDAKDEAEQKAEEQKENAKDAKDKVEEKKQDSSTTPYSNKNPKFKH